MVKENDFLLIYLQGFHFPMVLSFHSLIRELTQRRLIKKDLYFTDEIRNKCLDLFSTPMAAKPCSGYMCNDSV